MCYIYFFVCEHYNIAYILKFVNNSHQGHPILIISFKKSQLLHCEVTLGHFGSLREGDHTLFSISQSFYLFFIFFLFLGMGDLNCFIFTGKNITSNMWHVICLWLKRGMSTAIIIKHVFFGTIACFWSYMMHRKKAPPSGKKTTNQSINQSVVITNKWSFYPYIFCFQN